MNKPTPDLVVKNASKRPWTYRHDGRRDWIEDANGETILNNLGHLDGPLIVACVNEMNACGTEHEALHEESNRPGSSVKPG